MYYKWCLSTLVLRMVYIGKSDWYHASKVHSIYLSIILIVVTLPKFKSIHICKIEPNSWKTYVGGANTIKIENWFYFISLWWLSSITKKGEIKSPSLILVINDTKLLMPCVKCFKLGISNMWWRWKWYGEMATRPHDLCMKWWARSWRNAHKMMDMMIKWRRMILEHKAKV
jgi:hypothetical protein